MIKNNKQNEGRHGRRGGYTLLFAVLTATLVLGVAVFIVDLSRKQHELAVSARNSIYSFYAADSGIECAISASNWVSGSYASTTGGVLNCGIGSSSFVNTLIQTVGSLVISPTLTLYATVQNPIVQQTGFGSLSFDNLTTPTKGCVQLIITTGSSDNNSIKPVTVIDARGYNLCTSDTPPAPDITNTSTVERALRLVQSGVW